MAVVKNLTIDKYTTYEKVFIFLDKNKAPFDLTGYSANSQIRKSYKDAIIAEFSCEVLSPPEDGKILIRLDFSKTANTDPGKYQYDVLLSNPNSNEKIRAVEGLIDLTANITKVP